LSASPRALHVSPQQERLRRLFQARGCCDSHAARLSDCRRGGAAGCAALEELTEEEGGPQICLARSPTSLARCPCALRNLCGPLCPSMALCAALVFFFSLVGRNTNTNTVSVLSGSLPASARPACMNTHVVCHRQSVHSKLRRGCRHSFSFAAHPISPAFGLQLAACGLQRPKPTSSPNQTLTPWQRVRDRGCNRDHDRECVRACAAPSPPHLLARGSGPVVGSSSPSHTPANHSALTRIALHPV
jgi:hypothetical protein